MRLILSEVDFGDRKAGPLLNDPERANAVHAGLVDDDGDFEEFYREYLPRILGVAFLLTGDREEALDLAQETFTRAFERWNEVSRYDVPLAWLHQVVTNMARSRWRRARRLASTMVGNPHVPDMEAPEPAVVAALRDLTPAQRAVIVLRYYADLSVTEVAALLGKRPGTVRALTSQAFSRLRPLLDRTREVQV